MQLLFALRGDEQAAVRGNVEVTTLRPDAEPVDVMEAVAISTDPAEDTPRSIRRFLGRQDALGKLRFLDGEERELRWLWSRLGVLSSLESGRDDLHSAPVRVYDRRGVWVTTQHPGADLTPRNLAHDIRIALRSD
ncbi:MAG: SCO family protein [Solirubrobacteraceae bacterium]